MPPEEHLCPELSGIELLLDGLVAEFEALSRTIGKFLQRCVDQATLNVEVATMELRIGLLDKERPDFTLVLSCACHETSKSVSPSSLVCTEPIIDSNDSRFLAAVEHQ